MEIVGGKRVLDAEVLKYRAPTVGLERHNTAEVDSRVWEIRNLSAQTRQRVDDVKDGGSNEMIDASL